MADEGLLRAPTPLEQERSAPTPNKSVAAEMEARQPGAKPVAVKKRAALRAGFAARVLPDLLKHDEVDGIVPFASARTRTVLKAAGLAKPRAAGGAKLKGLR